MATDSTNLPQGETTLDAGIDMTASDLDLTTVQLAQTEPANYVDLPKGNTVILLPVQPGQTVRLPTDSTDGVLAKIGPEGNLALVVDGRTIILQGFLKANDQSPIKIVTNDGDAVDVAALVAATDPSLDIQTAAGPASGDQGDTDGSGIFVPFNAGPGLGGILAEGILDPTALQYRLIDDEFREFTEGEGKVTFDITFDILGGIINEDDLGADEPNFPPIDQVASAKFILGGKSGSNGEGNDPFDTTDREDEPGDEDGIDANGNGVDDDREPLQTVATIKANFPGGSGALIFDLNGLPDDLTSEGEKVSFALVPGAGAVGDIIYGFVDYNSDGKFNGFDRLVLSVEADTHDSTGEFKVKFTLYDNLDNAAPDADKNGEPDLLGADEQIFDLPVHFTLSGGGASADGELPLGVQDDIPFFGKLDNCGIELDITHVDVEITHDETPGVQPHSDDVSIFNPWVFWLGLDVGSQVDKAGFEFPFGDSEGSLIGAAKAKVHVSFGADGPAVFIDTDKADTGIRNSVYGALQDAADGTIDDKVSGGDAAENEHPFELFMVKDGTVPSSVTDGDLTIADQKTNATVTWDGDEVLDVWVQQIDANTIVGYVMPDGPEGDKVAVFALNIDDYGCLSFFQVHQLNHDVDGKYFPQHDDPLTILGENGQPLIYVRATDYDGDHAIQPVNLVIEDDGPRFCEVDWGHDRDSKHGVGLIDEDKLPHGIEGGPGDDDGGAHADGKVVFDFGADQPGHVDIQALKVKDQLGNVVLEIVLDENGELDVITNDLQAIDGKDIVVKKSMAGDDVVWTAYIADGEGNPIFSKKVFSFSLDTADNFIGEFDFNLYKLLEHPLTDGPYPGTQTSYEDNFKFDFTVRGYDSDGDYADGHVKLSVDDDSPDACKVEISFGEWYDDNKLVHDETEGVQNGGKIWPFDHDPDASWQDEDDIGYQPAEFANFEGDKGLDAIGYAKTKLNVDLSGGTHDWKAAFGADGPGSVSPVSIVDDHGGNFHGEKTNLHDTKTGQSIFLFTVVDDQGKRFVVGKVGGEHGPIAFALHVSASGNLEMAQYRAIKHPDDGDRDDSVTLLDCDGKAIIYLQVTVTDADGDSVKARQAADGRDGNPAIVFQDDGPVVECDNGKLVLAMDESKGFGFIAYDKDFPADPEPFKDGTAPENDEWVHFFDVLWSGLPVPPLPIGAAADNVQNLFKVDFGTDDGCVVCYDLTILCEKTNLKATETGTYITLVEGPHGIVKGVDGYGNIIFAIWLDKDSGDIVSAQYRAIDHGGGEPAPGAHDEVKFLGDGFLGVTATAYDKDGDKDSKTVDIGRGISFDDDGPIACIDKKHNNDVTHDESAGLQNDDRPNGSLPGVFSNVGLIGWARSDDPVVTIAGSEYGTDGAGTTVLSLKIPGDGTNSGLDDTATGNDILLYQSGDIVLGKVAGSGELVFAVSINQDGTIDVAQYRAIEHWNPNDHDEDVGLSNSALQAWVTVTDKDGDVATAHVDMGSRVRFDDDGPNAELAKVDGAKIVLDESAGLATGPYADGNAFDEDGNVVGDIGYAKVAGNQLFVDNSSYGTDGSGTKSYSLVLSSNNVDSGLDDVLTGANVILVQVNSATIEGRASVAGPDPVVFRITINQSDGEVTISQFRAVEHDNAGGSASTHDEAGSPEIMDSNRLFIRQTVVDGDLDKDTFDLDLGKLIKFEDDGPVAVNDVDSVDEDSGIHAIGNVYTGANGTSFGSDPNGTDGNKDDIGTDGFQSLQWKDPNVPGGIDGNGNIVGLYGTLFVQTDGDYKYVLNNSHPALDDLDDGEVLYDTFHYVIKDKDGDTSTAELKITINGKTDNNPPDIDLDPQNPQTDDRTAAVSDEGLTDGEMDDVGVPSDDTDSATFVGVLTVSDPDLGDVLTVKMIDPGTLPAWNFSGGHPVSWVLSVDGQTLTGTANGDPAITVQLGALVANSASYTVTLHQPLDHPVPNVEDELSFTIPVRVTDSAGAFDTAFLTIEVEDDSPEVHVKTSGTISLQVDETLGGVGDHPDLAGTREENDEVGVNPALVIPAYGTVLGAATAQASDLLEIQPGADGELSHLYELNVTGDGATGLNDTLTGQPITLEDNGAGLILGKTVPGGDVVFALTIDGTSGEISMAQYRAIEHADTDSHDDVKSMLAGKLSVTLSVTDKDHDTASQTVDISGAISFDDDGPKAVDDNVAATPGSTGTADVLFIVDVSGSMTNGGGSIVIPGDVPGFDENRLGLARYSMQQLLLSHPEILNVQFVKFDDDVDSPTSVWLTRAQALDYILEDSNFVGGQNTNYDLALAEAMSQYNNSSRPAGEAEQTLVYFLSDGQPNEDDDPGITDEGTGASEVSVAEWEAFVTNPANNITNVFAIGLGTAVVGQLEPIAYPNDDVNPPAGDEDRVVIIPDSNITALTQTLDDLLGSVLTPVSGDVTDNDDFGSDGAGAPELVSVIYDSTTYNFGPGTTVHTIDLGVGRGSLKIEDDGDYTYTPPSADTADGTPFYVEYVIRDGDGDTSTGKINIDLTVPPTTDNVFAAGDEDNIAGIPVVLTGSDTDGTVVSFKITSLPANGTLYADIGLTNPISVDELVSAAANTVYFVPNANYSGTTAFNYAAIDNEGAEDATPAVAEITVNPVNDAPDANITAPSYNATEQVNLALQGTGLSISDIDAGGGDVTVTLSVGFGILSVSAGNSGVGIGGNNSSSVTLTGTVAEINSLLDDSSTGTIAYNANSDNPPSNTTLTLHVNDNGNTGSGGSLTDSTNVTINIADAPEPPVAVNDRIYTNIGGDITVKDSWLLKNDTDADTAHASLIIASAAAAAGQAGFFDDQPSHAGTDVTFNLDQGNGGGEVGNGESTSFDYVVKDPVLQDQGNVVVTYDTSGSVNGSANDDILIGSNVGLQGGAGNDQIVGTGTTDLLDYSNIGTDWNLTLGDGGSGTATIDGTDTYEGIDGIIGGGGDNKLTGNSSVNRLEGGSGDDTLDGGNDAVSDTLIGGNGDDTLIFRTLDDVYDGGGNTDILDVSALGSVNFTGFTDSKIESVETLSLTGGSGTTVTLSADDIINFEGGNIDPGGGINTGFGFQNYNNAPVLTITGDATDTVNLVSGAGDTWHNAETNGATGVPAGYTLYVHVNNNFGNPAFQENAYVLVQDGVDVNLS